MNFFTDLFFKKASKVEPTAQPEDFRTPMRINDTLSKKYPEWTSFLPETLRVVLKNDFGITADEVLFNKVMATQTVLTCGFDWDLFEKICMSFNNMVPDFDFVEPLSCAELVWGLLCIRALNPNYKTSEDVDSYIRTVMKEEGLLWCPWTGMSVEGIGPSVQTIKDVWKSDDKVSDDPSVNIQIDRLSIIRGYVRSYE